MPHMAIYLVFNNCDCNVMEHIWTGDSIPYIINNIVKIIETRPREKGFVLWGHCQNFLDDHQSTWNRSMWYILRL